MPNSTKRQPPNNAACHTVLIGRYLLPTHLPLPRKWVLTSTKDAVCHTVSLKMTIWHVREASNPQPADLESAALPIELQTCGAQTGTRIQDLFLTKEVLYRLSYLGSNGPIAYKNFKFQQAPEALYGLVFTKSSSIRGHSLFISTQLLSLPRRPRLGNEKISLSFPTRPRVGFSKFRFLLQHQMTYNAALIFYPLYLLSYFTTQ